ncbi:MAG: S8 family serine peptidase, partial [Oscillospiraceae bacterium]|nr:S8 family serine peptidase [Oscillospiraceae bacterium]
MIRRTSAILIFTALLCSLASPPRAALADEPAVSGPAYAPDEIIVVFNETVDAPAAEAALDIIDAVGAETIDTPDDAITELVELPPDVSVAEAILELSRDPDVAFVQPNYIYTLADYAAAATPNDPYYGVAGYRWHLDKIDADEAWEILPKNGSAVRVAVIDYSPDITHPDLAGNIAAAAARDFSKGRGNSYPSDYNNHGTHVAGIIGAVSNNGIGVAGVATGGSNDVIEVIPINVFDSEGKAYTSSLIPAMTYGVSAGAKIINLSLGVEGDPYNYDAKLKSAVDAAVFGGVTVVCAAGNDGKLDGGEYANYPSHFASVISVVSTTSSDGRSSTSNYSDADNFVSAPGVSIYSTAAGGGYISLTGTSMAAPVTSGVVAMMLYVNPDLTPATVLNILKTTSAGPSNSTRYGGRRIDADAAVAAAKALRSISGSARISGAAKYGETLKAAVDGVPNDAGALSYAWKRDDAAIAGANTDAYTLTGDDIGRKIGVTVTAANYPNSALESAQTAAVEKADAPVVTAWPSASGVTYGQPLSYSTLSGGKISVGGGAFAWKEPNAVPTVLNNGYAVIFTPDAPTASLYKPIEAPEKTVSVTVSKANAPKGVNQGVSIIKGQTRGFDLASLLPNLPGLADARYAPAITSGDGGILGALNYSSGGTLDLSVLPGATAGNTATVAVPVSSGNYNDFEAEITVTAVDKT